MLAMEPRKPVACSPPPPAPAAKGSASESLQWIKVPQAPVYLLSAYLDDRLPGFPYVRIIAMVRGRSSPPPLFCHMHVPSDSAAVIVEALPAPIWVDEWAAAEEEHTLRPMLLSCPLPLGSPTHSHGERAQAVSVTAAACDAAAAATAMALAPPHSRRRGRFAVCVKGLDFPSSVSSDEITPLGDAFPTSYYSDGPELSGDIRSLANNIGIASDINSLNDVSHDAVHVNDGKVIPLHSNGQKVRSYAEIYDNSAGNELNSKIPVVNSASASASYPFSDSTIALRLVEWLELHLMFGADHFFMYDRRTGPRVQRVLKFYSDRGLLTTVRLPAPPLSQSHSSSRTSSPWDRRRWELLPYNDCLYRNVGAFEFIIPLDIDEVLIPVAGRTWRSALSALEKQSPGASAHAASLSARHTLFPPASASHPSFSSSSTPLLITLRDVSRTPFSPAGAHSKSFVRASPAAGAAPGDDAALGACALTVHNHWALRAVAPGATRSLPLPTSVAQLNHYRWRCGRPPLWPAEACAGATIRDDVLPRRFGKRLRRRAVPVLKALRLIP